jgi:hypothetical protein
MGEHTEAIMAELGFTAEETATLKRETEEALVRRYVDADAVRGRR